MKNKINEFIEACISSGKVIITSSDIKLSHSDIIEIEDILNRFNDKAATLKIKKHLTNQTK
jgi:hypothetical protein